MFFRRYCLPLLLVAHAHAISISVFSTGGNDTSPLEYGLMYEVGNVPLIPVRLPEPC